MQDFRNRLAAGKVTVHHHHAEFQPEAEKHSESDQRHWKENRQTDAHSHNHPHANARDHSHSHDHSHSLDHDHSHGHSHRHHHEPYRHIAHPHGPRTMIGENICCCFMSQFPADVVEEEMALRAVKEKSTDENRIPQCKKS